MAPLPLPVSPQGLKRLLRSIGLAVDCLTPRDGQVLGLVLTGMLNKQVAGELGAAEKTIKAHRGRIKTKTHAKSLADLTRMTVKIGIGVVGNRPWGKPGRHRTKAPYPPVRQLV